MQRKRFQLWCMPTGEYSNLPYTYYFDSYESAYSFIRDNYRLYCYATIRDNGSLIRAIYPFREFCHFNPF